MFRGPVRVLSWWMFSRLCILLLLDEIGYRCQLYPDIDSVVDLNYIVTDFLPAGYVHFFFKFFLLKYSWFTMLLQFLLYNKVTQSYIHIYSFLFFFSFYFPSCSKPTEQKQIMDVESRLVFSTGQGGEKGLDREFGIGTCKILHLEWIVIGSYCTAQKTVSNRLG